MRRGRVEPEIGGMRKRKFDPLASVCVDLRVTQVVNEARGVHAVLRHEAFSA